MTTVIQQNPSTTESSIVRPLVLDNNNTTTVQVSPKQLKKPSRNTSNLADIATINATRFNGSPLSVAIQNGSLNDRKIKQMEASHAASLQVAPERAGSSSDTDSLSYTSYQSDKSRSPVNKFPVVINLEENDTKKGSSDDGIWEGKKLTNEDDYQTESKVVEGKGLGGRDTYLSAGKIVFKVIESRFTNKVNLEKKNKPYFKFRMGFNTGKSGAVRKEGSKLIYEDDINVKYTNQDSVFIKVKSKGALIDNTIGKVRVSVIDVVNSGSKTEVVPLMKGDEIVGEMKLEMIFQAKH